MNKSSFLLEKFSYWIEKFDHRTEMGRLFVVQLESSKIYTCSKCKTNISTKEEVISKGFHGKYGTAYLVNKW